MSQSLDATTGQVERNLAIIGSVNVELEQRRAASTASFCHVLLLMLVVVCVFAATVLLIQVKRKPVRTPA